MYLQTLPSYGIILYKYELELIENKYSRVCFKTYMIKQVLSIEIDLFIECNNNLYFDFKRY